MKFIEHLLNEGLAKKQVHIPGLDSREAEIMIKLVAKAITAHLAEEWKYADEEDGMDPTDLMADGIYPYISDLFESNYQQLWNIVEAGVRKFE